MLANSGNITAQETERFCSSTRSEGTSDFLLDFQHTQVALGLIVVKRDAKIRQKGQGLSLILLQVVEHVFGGGLGGMSALVPSVEALTVG